MKYRVIWLPIAKAQFREIWTRSKNRADVKRAAIAFEKELSNDPHNAGESRFSIFRIISDSPLFANYTVDDRTNTVYILSVRGK